MTPKKDLVLAIFAAFSCCFGILMGSPALAFDFTGAWGTSREACTKVFIDRGGKLALTTESDMHGGGFIVEGTQIRGKIAKCRIKSRRETAKTLDISATCLTDIMPSDVEFTFTIIDPDKIARKLGGVTEMEIEYVRCSL